MFFEGTEKKIEVIVRGAALRQMPRDFWQGMVESAGAKVLSSISNQACDSYLLSESSLFVWDDRFTMITCGTTQLANAAAFFFAKVPPDKVDFLSFERKNAYYPHRQSTDFLADVEVLQRYVPGKIFRFGSPDEHHLYLFHLDKGFVPKGVDSTLEILMYELEGQTATIFNRDQTIERVRQLTRLENIFPGFEIDDHLFEPCGYSLNAIKGQDYYTIHVTPEKTGSYVSFETNVHLGARVTSVVRNVLEVFQPRSFDVIYFHSVNEMAPLQLPPFMPRSHVHQSLSCGFEVDFATFSRPVVQKQMAVALGG